MSHNTELRLKTPKERLQPHIMRPQIFGTNPPQSSYTNVRRHHAVEDKALGFRDYLSGGALYEQCGEGEPDTAEHFLLTCPAFINQREEEFEVRKIGGFLEEDRMRAVVY
ncbi:hypothetical protein BT69DRAFT_1276108 [Atractiella rhizophila]|nr:hypothetical protein BT69DRAFT_1276108 [Atractiella rhizophila]